MLTGDIDLVAVPRARQRSGRLPRGDQLELRVPRALARS